MDASRKPKVALIAGPTASGKSALAMRLAEEVGGVVVNADASQVYRDLRILSARPSPTEEARVPHRLFGYRDGALSCSAAEWAADAREAVAAILADGRTPILTGGSGLYLRTLLDGIAPVPEIDRDVRETVRALSTTDAHAALLREDPDAAARIRPSDTARVMRALEVVRSTGRPIGAWHQERVGGLLEEVGLVPLILLPPRAWLHQRIASRFEAMLGQGAAEEVEALLGRDLAPDLPVMRAIGVREIAHWLRGETDRETMIEAATAASRQYAKRQYTWFRHQPPAGWLRADEQLEEDQLRSHAIILRNGVLT